MGGSAEVSAEAKMQVKVNYTVHSSENEVKPFGQGNLVTEDLLELGADFGQLKKISETGNEGYAGSIGSMGVSVAASSKSDVALVVDKAKFSKSLLGGLQAANQAFVAKVKEIEPNK